jgi:hypothetical protein
MVLVLRTGVDLARAYSPATVAAMLHIGARDVTRLERQALRQLRLSARTHGCGAASQTWGAVGVFGAFGQPAGEAGLVGGETGALGGEGGALGEVKDLHAATPSPRERSGPPFKRPYPDGNAVLGVSTPPGSTDTWLMAVMIVVGVLLAAFLFADEQWRSRWLPRWLPHWLLRWLPRQPR